MPAHKNGLVVTPVTKIVSGSDGKKASYGKVEYNGEKGYPKKDVSSATGFNEVTYDNAILNKK